MLARNPHFYNSTCISQLVPCSSYQVFANESSDAKSKKSTPHQSEYSKRVKFLGCASILLAGLLTDELFAQFHGFLKPRKVLLEAVVRSPLGCACRGVTSAPLAELDAIVATALWWLNEWVQFVSQLGTLNFRHTSGLVSRSATDWIAKHHPLWNWRNTEGVQFVTVLGLWFCLIFFFWGKKINKALCIIILTNISNINTQRCAARTLSLHQNKYWLCRKQNQLFLLHL